MQNIQFFIRKLIGLLFILVYYNVFFILFTPDIYDNPWVVIALIFFFGYLFIEQIYKIEPPEEYTIQLRDIIIIIFFFIHPFILILSFLENQIFILPILPVFNDNLVKIFCILFLIIGMIITFSSRIQLGKFGTTTIQINEDHQLITTGIYKYIRHPIYLGALIQYSMLSIAIGSLFITSLTFLLWIILVYDRITLEERLLIAKFDDKYINYMKQTKRFIPFLF